MKVSLTQEQLRAIDFWGRRAYFWQHVENCLHGDDWESDVCHFAVRCEDPGDFVSEYIAEQEAGHDPLQGVHEELRAIADRIVDHVFFVEAYGESDEDLEDMIGYG